MKAKHLIYVVPFVIAAIMLIGEVSRCAILNTSPVWWFVAILPFIAYNFTVWNLVEEEEEFKKWHGFAIAVSLVLFTLCLIGFNYPYYCL